VLRSKSVEGLAALDDSNLRRLAELAAELNQTRSDINDASWADMSAVDNLRLAARIVFRSGIEEHTAR